MPTPTPTPTTPERATPTPGPEKRTRLDAGLAIERRAEGDAPQVVGHAAVFDRWTTLYEGRHYVWREVLRPGCFRNALAEGQDVRALFNHDPGSVLGRTRSGTLRLAEDAVGLRAEIDPPDTQLGRDVCALIARGDVSGMSFGFRVRDGGEIVTIRDDGHRVVEEREVTDCDLLDVSPVTYPAYDQTDVSLRSFGEGREREVRSRLDRTPRRDRAARLLRLAEVD